MSSIVLEEHRGDDVIVRWLLHSDTQGTSTHVVSATAAGYIAHSTGAHAKAMLVVAEPVHRALRQWVADGRPDERPWSHLLTHRILPEDGVTFVPMNATYDEEEAALDATAKQRGIPRPKRSGMAPPLTPEQEKLRTDNDAVVGDVR